MMDMLRCECCGELTIAWHEVAVAGTGEFEVICYECDATLIPEDDDDVVDILNLMDTMYIGNTAEMDDRLHVLDVIG